MSTKGNRVKEKDGTSTKEYKFGEKGISGHVKLGYDNKKVTSSLKYDFSNKELTTDGSYTYKTDKLTVKPSASLMFDVTKVSTTKTKGFDPTNLTLKTDVKYKLNDKLTVKNNTTLETSVNGAKGKIVAPEFLKGNEISSEKTDLIYFALNDTITAEYSET